MPRFADKDFGMALGNLEMPCDMLQDYLGFRTFTAIEFPLKVFLQNSSSLFRAISPGAFYVVHCSGIMDRDLSRTIAFSPESLQKDFAEEACFVLERLHAGNCLTASLECDMDQIFNDSDSRNALIGILHRLAPTLLRNRMTLLLPFRVPVYSPERPSMMNRFLRDAMIPGLKLRLDIHPYELEDGFSPKDSVGILFREVRSVTFLYDADCGNRITKKILRPWLEALDACAFSGPFLLAPYSMNQRMAFPEAESFAKIIADLRNE